MLNAAVPVGSVTDELDVFKVFFSRCFGFSLWWCSWDCGPSTLQEDKQILIIQEATGLRKVFYQAFILIISV